MKKFVLLVVLVSIAFVSCTDNTLEEIENQELNEIQLIDKKEIGDDEEEQQEEG